MMKLVARVAWVMAFVALPLVPVAILVQSGRMPSSSLGIAVALGLVAVSGLVGTVVVSSRLRSLTGGLGIEQLLAVHRGLGLVVLGLVLAHVAAVLIANPSRITYLDLLHASPGMRAATLATIALVVLTVSALLRRRLRVPYGVWRILHVILAAVIVAGGAVHVLLLNNLVRDDGMGVWFAAITASLVVVLLLRWVLRPLLAARSGFRVREVRRESREVSTLVLAPTRGRLFPRRRRLHFAPGQFAWLRLRRWGLFTDHPFTIASGTRTESTVEFTVRHLGHYTRTLGRLSPGARVFLDGPHGSFSVDRTHATGLVLLAGGVGITPMMSMLRTLADRGDRRPHRLLVSGRSRDDLLFLDELADLQERLHLTVVPTLTRPHRGWTGPSGRIDATLLATVLPGPFRRNQLDYFLCGSAPFVSDMATALDEIGIPRQRVHTEQFDIV